MKHIFAHMADIHLDSPFEYLNDEVKQNERRVEQRIIFKQAIKDAFDKKCEFVLISGDVFDGEVADVFTIKYIDETLSMYENMKFIIIAGNHDLYNKNKLLYTYNFKGKNIIVLSKDNPMISFDDVCIYGYADESTILDEKMYNILMHHGNVKESESENPLPSYLKNKGFNYIALGHVHQFENHSTSITSIYYPGCLIARGFDELNEKGYLLIEVNENVTNVKFNKVNQRQYVVIRIDVSLLDYESIYSVINEINKQIKKPNDLYKIELVGNRNVSSKINKTHILSEFKDKLYFIKLKDSSVYQSNKVLSPIEKLFIEKIEEMIKNASVEEKERLINAKAIGLKALRNEVILDENN